MSIPILGKWTYWNGGSTGPALWYSKANGIGGSVAPGAFFSLDSIPAVGLVPLLCAAPPCPADLNGDGTLNFFDVSAFLAAFSAQEPAADFTGDGLFNFFDVSAFLSMFSAGCP